MIPLLSLFAKRSLARKGELRLINTSQRVFSDNQDSRNSKQNATLKLNALLKSIVEEGEGVEKSPKNAMKPSVQLPKARTKIRADKAASKPKKPQSLGGQIVDAAKDIALKIGGDKSKTEAELLHKLLFKESTLKDEILQKSDNQALGDILKRMQVEVEGGRREEGGSGWSRADQVRAVSSREGLRRRPPANRRERRVDLWGEAGGLGLLRGGGGEEVAPRLATWQACLRHELCLSTTHPPASYWHRLIYLTDKGIIWKFPINNQQGAAEEESFASHVLLEDQLEGWCPPTGPLRHFMELVCVGLSRNHYLSGAEKRDHILWYKNYFTDKNHILEQIGLQKVFLPPQS